MENIIDNIARNFEEIMKVLEIEKTESNQDTPKRLAKMFANELFKNRNNNNLEDLKETFTTFPNEGNYENLVIVKDIPFVSTCEHHWVNFEGEVTIGYVPDERIAGLSKFPRVVKFFSQKPQLQERLVTEIGNFLVEQLTPKALFIRMDARHGCVRCRGAESDCATLTSYQYVKDANSMYNYLEFLNKIGGR